MNRKDTLRTLLGSSKQAPKNEVAPSSSAAIADQAPLRIGSGAVRAMGLSLQKLTAEADQGRALQAQLEAGSYIVDLEPDLIDPSFVADRLSPADDDAFRDLVESIGTHGQQVPILARPHPEQPGRYQLAYGHRRLRAVAVLKKKIRAVIRNMTDAELVIAQGKENLERRDLSFIERALFAKSLEDRGFERATIMAALAIHKAEMTRFITVARSVPVDIIQAIGPAPKAGRPRWMMLAHHLKAKHAGRTLERLFTDSSFKSTDSDSRFVRVLAALDPMPMKSIKSNTWRNCRGQPVIRIEYSATTTRLAIDEKLAPEFGAFVVEKLSNLYDDFLSQTAQKHPDNRLNRSEQER
jgi:ParB family transcriptional regulator, chromosome partitioning protein